MSFISNWPFFLLILIPVIILLYLLKQKAEDKVFSSLFLWKEAYKNVEASAPWEKLKNNLLMYLQILTVLFLIFAVASPYLRQGGSQYQNVVLAIDISGSMNTKYDDKSTRFEKVMNETNIYVDSLKEGTSVTILSMGKTTTILGANISDKMEVKRILSEMRPADYTGNPNLTLNLIASMAEQWENYEAIFYTDESLDLGAIQGRIVNVNSMGPNGCIDYVSYGYDEPGITVLVKVSNPSPYDFSSDINLYIDDEMIDISYVDLKPGESKMIYFENIEVEGSQIKAEINEKDYLSRDNTGYALLNTSEVKKALLITGQNVFIEKAVTTISGVELYKTNDVENISEEDIFDLFIFDGVLPEVLPKTGNLIFINPPDAMEGMIGESKQLENVMITAQPHDITRYMENYSFGVTKTQVFEPPVWGKSFLKAGDQSAAYIGEQYGRKIGVFGFDFHHSDFPLQTEFPIFINNLINQSLERGIVNTYHYKVGDILNLNPDPEGSDVTIRNPLGEEMNLPVAGITRSYDYLDYAGIYQLAQTIEENNLQESIVVDFPTGQESVIKLWEDDPSVEVEAKSEVRGGRDLRNLVIAIILILLGLEWFVYIRRV